MAFDRTNPTDLATLKNEVVNNAAYYGDINGPEQPLLKKLNDPSQNRVPQQTARLFDVEAMLDALDPTDYDAQQTVAGAQNYVHTLVEYQGVFGPIFAFKNKFRSMFAANSNTVQALDAQTRDLSRAEALFDAPDFTDQTVIDREDWLAAKNS